MEMKKTAQLANRDASGRKVFEFFGDLKQEFKNVAWTPKHELQAYTKIVVAATFIFGFLIYFIDLFIQGVLNGIEHLVKLLGA
jgi:preprotein translocase SecE subunit